MFLSAMSKTQHTLAIVMMVIALFGNESRHWYAAIVFALFAIYLEIWRLNESGERK